MCTPLTHQLIISPLLVYMEGAPYDPAESFSVNWDAIYVMSTMVMFIKFLLLFVHWMTYKTKNVPRGEVTAAKENSNVEVKAEPPKRTNRDRRLAILDRRLAKIAAKKKEIAEEERRLEAEKNRALNKRREERLAGLYALCRAQRERKFSEKKAAAAKEE